MVEEGLSNDQIYQRIKQQYGKQQIAVPRQGWNVPLSYGIPYVMLVLMGFGVFWYSWYWIVESEVPFQASSDNQVSPEDSDRLDELQEKISDKPTRS